MMMINMSSVVINETIQIPWSELHWTSVRSQGPGGQNVNKVNSKVVLRWHVAATEAIPEAARQRLLKSSKAMITREGWLILTSQQGRNRPDNLDDCIQKLRLLVLAALKEPKKRLATRPTAGSRRRKRKDKEELTRKKQLRRPMSPD